MSPNWAIFSTFIIISYLLVFIKKYIPGSIVYFVLLSKFFQKSFSTQIFFVAKNFYSNIFWPKNLLIDWQNCCNAFNYVGPLYTYLVLLDFSSSMITVRNFIWDVMQRKMHSFIDYNALKEYGTFLDFTMCAWIT